MEREEQPARCRHRWCLVAEDPPWDQWRCDRCGTVEEELQQESDPEVRIALAATAAARYGGIEGAHHKQWLIDVLLRLLLVDRYPAWVVSYDAEGEYAPWDGGIPP